MAQLNPSPTKPIVSYPTALLEDRELVTLHDTRLPDYKPLEYGTPFKDQVKFPGVKLVYQEPFGEDDRMVRRIWAGDRRDQDTYNADRKYSGGSMDHPIIVRKYVFPEEGYVPLPTGTEDPYFSGAVLVDEEVTRPENRNGYVSVTRVYETIPGPILTGVIVTEKGQLANITTQTVTPGTTVVASALTVSASVKPDSKGKSLLEKIEVPELFDERSFSIENPDPVPQKFRIAAPSTTTEETVIGTAAQPSLATGELAASEQQITKFTKRKKKTSRSTTALPKSLNQTATTNSGLKAAVVETLQVGDTSDAPSALVSVESEAMGDGTYVVRKTTLPEVFDEKSFAIENPDPVPQKFRIAAPSTTTEETVIGTAAQPSLATGELAASEQQITKFTKRKKKTSRSTTALPVELTQTTTNSDGLKAVVTETLQVGDTSDTPSATVFVESEAMGDGTYVVKKTEVPEVFDQKAVSVQKPDVIPERYRASIPSKTTVDVVAATEAATPTLSVNDLEKSEQRVSAFTVKRSTTSRDSQTQYPTLHGQDYDSSIGAVIPYIERVVSSGAEAGSDLTEVTPLSDQLDLARTIDVDLLKDTLDDIHLQFPSRTTLSLPPVLISVGVVWDTFSDEGDYTSDWAGGSSGISQSLSGSERGEAKSIAGVTPSFITKMRDTWATNIPTTTHVFFLPYPCTEAHILSKVNAAKWPTFKPESATITAFGQKVGVSVEANVSAAQSKSRYEDDDGEYDYNVSWDKTVGVGASKSFSQTVVVANIPACLHGSILITNATKQKSVGASISIGWAGNNFPSVFATKANTGSATGSVYGTDVVGSVPRLPATSPADIPRSGMYLIDSKVDIYQHGYLKVYAEVLDASVLA